MSDHAAVELHREPFKNQCSGPHKSELRHFGEGHGNGIHDFLMDELEIGYRAAYAADLEAAMGSWEPLASAFDPAYPGYIGRAA